MYTASQYVKTGLNQSYSAFIFILMLQQMDLGEQNFNKKTDKIMIMIQSSKYGEGKCNPLPKMYYDTSMNDIP